MATLSVLSEDSILPGRLLRRRHRRPLAQLRSLKQTSAEAADGPRPPIVTKEPWALLVIFEAASRAFEDYRDMDGRIRFANRESRNGGVITACLTCLHKDTLGLCHQGKSRRPAAMLAPASSTSQVSPQPNHNHIFASNWNLRTSSKDASDDDDDYDDRRHTRSIDANGYSRCNVPAADVHTPQLIIWPLPSARQ